MPKRNRILVEINPGTFEFPPGGYSPSERFAFGLLRSLRNQINVLAVDFGDADVTLKDEVNIHRIRNRFRLQKKSGLAVYSWNSLTSSLALFCATLRGRLPLQGAIMHFHNGLQYSIFRRLQRLFMSKMKLIYVFRLQSPKWMNPSLVPLWLKVVAVPTELYAIDTAQIVTFESEAVKSAIEKLGHTSLQSLVLPNAVDTEFFRKERWQNGAIEAHGILYAARIKRQKNQLGVLRAMVKVLEKEPRAKLLFVGDPEELDYHKLLLHQLSNLNLKGNIQFYPTVDIQTLNRIRARYPIQLVYSSYTGFDVAVGESLAMGVACVMSDIPPLKGIAINGVNCVLVPPNSPIELATALIDLLGDPQKISRLGAEARRTAETQLSLHRAASLFFQALRRALREEDL